MLPYPEDTRMLLPVTRTPPPATHLEGTKAITYLMSRTYSPPTPCAFIFNILILRSEMKQIQVGEIEESWRWGRKKGEAFFMPQG